MSSIGEVILYYVPVTLAACLVYGTLKRPTLRQGLRHGVRYFLMFTLLVVLCVVVMEALLYLLVDA